MEAFGLLKFWKSNTAKVAAGTTVPEGDGACTTTGSAVCCPPTAETDDDDSFFELELTLPSYDSKLPKPDFPPKKPEQERKSELKPSLKPQSPISILRSAPPKLRVFMFGRFKRRAKREEIETKSVSSASPRRSSSKLLTVKFKIKDGSFVPELSRSDSSSFSSPKLVHRRSFDDCCESSKRFSKDVVQKYLNLIKPPYVKSSKRENSVASPIRSTPSLPSMRKHREEKQSSMFKQRCRHLVKCKSASSTIGAPSPAPVNFSLRNDHFYDGIEGAILHCKRSLNPSKGNPSLSRCNSDPSHEKSLIVSE
uniref:Membrane-associated kinase regulator 5 n=1 Tax=Opuntia streptacantha TaxID=393608 RepID=A0A7C9CZR7_OPUST